MKWKLGFEEADRKTVEAFELRRWRRPRGISRRRKVANEWSSKNSAQSFGSRRLFHFRRIMQRPSSLEEGCNAGKGRREGKSSIKVDGLGYMAVSCWKTRRRRLGDKVMKKAFWGS